MGNDNTTSSKSPHYGNTNYNLLGRKSGSSWDFDGFGRCAPHKTVSSIPLSAFEFPMRLGCALLWMSVSLPLNWSDFVRQAGSFWWEQKGIHQEEEESLNDGSSVNGSFSALSFYPSVLSDQSVIRSTHGTWREKSLVMNGLWRWIYINLEHWFPFLNIKSTEGWRWTPANDKAALKLYRDEEKDLHVQCWCHSRWRMLLPDPHQSGWTKAHSFYSPAQLHQSPLEEEGFERGGQEKKDKAGEM